MENLYKDLASLKEAKNDVNKDFNECTSKIDTLSSTYKNFMRNLRKNSTNCSNSSSIESDSDTDDNNKNNNFTDSVNSTASTTTTTTTTDDSDEEYIIVYDENNNEVKTKNDKSSISQKIATDDYNELMNMLMKNFTLGEDKQR